MSAELSQQSDSQPIERPCAVEACPGKVHYVPERIPVVHEWSDAQELEICVYLTCNNQKDPHERAYYMPNQG
jgi:hypothetical protein